MMKSALIASTLMVAIVGAAPIDAKGCLKGAAIGGVGGHVIGKGHAVLGAAAGCAIGHHRAKVAARKAAAKPGR